jgi:hypothetical protein
MADAEKNTTPRGQRRKPPRRAAKAGDEQTGTQKSSIWKKVTLAGLSTFQRIIVGVIVAVIAAVIVSQILPDHERGIIPGEEPPPLAKPPTAIQAKDAAVPDAKGPVKEQVWAPQVPTYAEPFKLAGAGRSIPHNRYVLVSCKLYWPHPESVEKDGYWYRIITKPWNGRFSPANSFWNGDKPGKPLTHATDFHVRDCREGELPDGG